MSPSGQGESAARKRLEAGMARARANAEFVAHVAEFRGRSTRARNGVLQAFATLIRDVDALPVAQRPVGWQAAEARAAMDATVATLGALWVSYASRMARPSEATNTGVYDAASRAEAAVERLIAAFVAPDAISPTTVMERSADEVASMIVNAMTTEAERRGLGRGAPAPMGFPSDGTAEDLGNAPHAKSASAWDAQTRALEWEISAFQQAHYKERPQASSYFSRLRLSIASRVTATTNAVAAAWVKHHSLKVFFGFLITVAVGATVRLGGHLVTSHLLALREDVADYLNRDAPELVRSASASVAEAEVKIRSAMRDIDGAFARSGQAEAQMIDSLGSLPATWEGVSAMRQIQERIRSRWIDAYAAAQKTTAADAASVFDAETTKRISDFTNLVSELNAPGGPLTRDAADRLAASFQEIQHRYLADYAAHVKGDISFSLEEYTRIRTALSESSALLVNTGLTMKALLRKTEEAAAKFDALKREEDRFRTKSPISAWIADAVGHYMGDGFLGQAMWATCKEAMYLSQLESTVNVAFDGFNHLLADSVDTFMAFHCLLAIVRLLDHTAVALRGLGFFRAFVTRCMQAAGLVSKETGYATVLAEAADESLGAFHDVASFLLYGGQKMAAVYSIYQSLRTVLGVAMGFGLAYALATGVVVGVAFAVYALKFRKPGSGDPATPLHAMGHVGSVLFRDSLWLSPVLASVAYIAEWGQMSPTAIAVEVPPTPDVQEMPTDVFKHGAVVKRIRKGLTEYSAELSGALQRQMSEIEEAQRQARLV